jgi:hypothetical protein
MKFSFERGQSKLSGERGNCKLLAGGRESELRQQILPSDFSWRFKLRAAGWIISRKFGFDIATKVRHSVRELTATFPLPY